MKIHVVKSGESVYAIARRYGVGMEDIIYANQLAEPDVLAVGQALVIPGADETYTVRRGDTMYSIASRNSLSLQRLVSANPQIKDPARIYPGQTLRIPSAAPEREIIVDGYASSVSDKTLSEQLGYLTLLSPFSYMASVDGTLTPSFSVSTGLSEKYGVKNLLTVTNLRPGGGFSSSIAHALLTQQAGQDAFMENALALVKDGGYYGLSLDFEYVYPFDRESFMQFLRRLAGLLHENGYILAVAAAPKTSAGQPGLLYTAHDYEQMGKAADLVILMTYEWGYTYGPAMAVAPVNMVRRVLDYAVSAVEPGKLLMGMPNYGYDWTLPFRAGTAARPLTNVAAAALAGEVGAQIRFDETAQAPFFTYYDGSGREHEVWFEDARSVRAKLGLVREYGLAGVSIWNINSLFRAMYLVLEDSFGTEKLS